jgi:hypothetical protein
MFLSIDGGCSWISSSGTSQGAHHRRFLVLMVDAPRSPALAPVRGSTVNVFYIGGERSRISVSTHQGAYRRRFLAWMVDAPESLAPTPPKGPAVDVF